MQLSEIKFQGIIPATVTPMNKSFQIAEEDLRRYIEWITGFRIGGLAINVDTGEGPALSAEERKMTIRVVSSVVKRRVPIIAGVSPSNTKDAASSAAEAREAGADALLVFPHPAFLGVPLTSELPYQYHKAIADAAHLPIIIFQLQPALGGYELTEQIISRLVEIPEVVAMKEALFDAVKFTQAMRILRNAPRRITMLTGNDNFIAESLILGAEGALIGFGTLATDQQIQLFELVRMGKYPEAMEIWNNIRPLMDVIFAPPVRDYRARTKVALALQAVIENVQVRPPLQPISKAEVDKIRKALHVTGISIERQPSELIL